MDPRLKAALPLAVLAVVVGGFLAGPLGPRRISSSYTVAVIGDYGCQSGTYCGSISSQKETVVANLVHGWSPDAIFTVGDNSYEHGCAGTAFGGATNTNCANPTNEVSLDQAPWSSDISARKFYEVPGNHDFENKANVIGGASSLTDCSSSANCGYLYNRPSHYTAHLGAGLVDLFALNVRGSDPNGTGAASAQATAYTNDYNASSAVWKIVTQHESNWSSGQHGSFAGDLAPHSGQPTAWTIKPGIDLFLSGHDHDMEHLTCKWNSSAKDCSGGGAAQHFAVVGVSGKNLYGFAGHPACPFTGLSDVENCLATTVWRDSASPYHFGAVKLTFTHGTSDTMKVEYFSSTGSVLHSFSLTKNGGATTGDVSGTITDAATSSPIVGATVSCCGTDVQTNGSGNYTLTAVPTGAQTLAISADGYLSATKNVTVPASGQNQALTPGTATFASGFEPGNFSEWTSSTANAATNVCSSGGATVCTPYLGTYAARLNPNNTAGGTSVSKTFANNGTIDINANFKVDSTTTNASLFYFQTGAGGNMFHPFLDFTTHAIGLRIDFGTPSTINSCTITPTPPWTSYHLIEFQVTVAGSGNSNIQGWYDGTQITWPNPSCPGSNSTSQNVGNVNAGQVIVGDTASNRVFDLTVDNVAVDTKYIGQSGRTLSGTVTDQGAGGAALSGATVALAGGASTTTDTNGNYAIPNVPGNQTVTLTASATHYQSSAITFFLPTGDTPVDQDFALTLTPGSITGKVLDATTGAPLVGADVSDDENAVTTDGSGNYVLGGQPPGPHTVTAAFANHSPQDAVVSVPFDGGSVTVNFNLAPANCGRNLVGCKHPTSRSSP